MTVRMELDDMTPLDATDVRAALVSQQNDDRVIVHLTHDNGAELVVGFRDDRGVCMWDLGGNGVVTTGGDNDEVSVYGWSGIPFPPGAEIEAAAVLNAAEEFAASGARPTCVSWTSYHEAMPAGDATITPDELRALLDQPDAGR